ncbi:MAG: ATP-grasp domain-containing protein [Deltaproteobacteria bacterium]
MSPEPPFLVVAVTGRALAGSAARGGRPVVVLDLFDDRDTRAVATLSRAVRAPRRLRFDGRVLLAAARALAPAERCAGLIYGAGFEGRLDLLRQLAVGRRLYGNDPAVVAAVRDPGRFFRLLDRLGIGHPQVRRHPPGSPSGWLVKHAGGAGGTQVRFAAGGRPGAGSYFQRFEAGRTLSAVFLADGRRACIVGVNEQWTAPARTGRPFLYGGAVGGVALPAPAAAKLRADVDALVAATGLVGLNGIDFLLREEECLVLEVNPRPTATLDLYDEDYPGGLFAAHLRACRGELPRQPAPMRAVRAHAVVYAAAPGRVGIGFAFASWCRDLPHPGARFAAGDPICTVHAAARDAAGAITRLRRRRSLLEGALRAAAA